jgi:hypothetical protein
MALSSAHDFYAQEIDFGSTVHITFNLFDTVIRAFDKL